jgi:hypothetical protein
VTQKSCDLLWGNEHVAFLMQYTSLNFNGFFKKDQFTAKILLSYNGDREREARDFQQ